MKWFKELIPYFLLIVIVVLVRSYIITPVRVNGSSMDPTLKNNEIVLLKKYDKHYERFDIVIFDYHDEKLVKRIIGLPGETVRYKDGKLYINQHVVSDVIDYDMPDFSIKELGYDVIPTDYYFVLGDNRGNSLDSRVIGLIHKDDILGTANFALFPFDRFGKIY